MPPTPAMFSIRIGCPRAVLSPGAMRRATKSVEPPGAYWTTIVSGRLGHDCDATGCRSACAPTASNTTTGAGHRGGQQSGHIIMSSAQHGAAFSLFGTECATIIHRVKHWGRTMATDVSHDPAGSQDTTAVGPDLPASADAIRILFVENDAGF